MKSEIARILQELRDILWEFSSNEWSDVVVMEINLEESIENNEKSLAVPVKKIPAFGKLTRAASSLGTRKSMLTSYTMPRCGHPASGESNSKGKC
jgi:hypothetical protein